MKKVYCLFLGLLMLAGCTTASQQMKDVKSDEGDRVTVGKVQREIHIGMPSSQVIEALGSPNIVTTDENRLEVWVYDKFATDVTSSSSKGYFWIVIAGVQGETSASSKTQRTLTIVIKFDADKKVRDFAYHSSSF